MDPRGLIRIALHLADGGVGGRRGRPRQVDLRRALSTAYYAMFHTLAGMCANVLVGAGAGEEREVAWRQTDRSLEHGYAKGQCDNQLAMNRFPVEVQQFGKHFSQMQVWRNAADYDPGPEFFRSEVSNLISQTERSMELLTHVSRSSLRAFALHVLLRQRR